MRVLNLVMVGDEDELDDHACSGGGSSEDNPTPPPSMMIRNYDKSDNEDQFNL